MGASISHKLHTMIEQYAQLFKSGARTPVLRRPDDYGMPYEEVFLLIHGQRGGHAILDALGAQDEKLLWIEESNQRFCAYNHFG